MKLYSRTNPVILSEMCFALLEGKKVGYATINKKTGATEIITGKEYIKSRYPEIFQTLLSIKGDL